MMPVGTKIKDREVKYFDRCSQSLAKKNYNLSVTRFISLYL